MPTKNKYLDEHKDEIIRKYQGGIKVADISKDFGVRSESIRYRLKKWGIFKARRYGVVIEQIKLFEKELLEDRQSGMTYRFLELKYGVNEASLFHHLKQFIKGSIPERKPTKEEKERILEDLNSELFFLDELSHFYCLTEKSILRIAYENKCVVDLDYDDTIDFLEYDRSMTLNEILNERKGSILSEI